MTDEQFLPAWRDELSTPVNHYSNSYKCPSSNPILEKLKFYTHNMLLK
jgi:hypothetical protein